MFLRHGEYSLLAFIGIGTATIGTLLFILLQREHSRHTAWLQNKSFKMASLETGAKENNYYEAVRLLLFALKHDPETRDDRGRDLLVLTTDLVAPEHEKQLENEGAIIRHVEFLDWAFEGSDSPHIPSYKHQETKLRIFEQDDYDILMYIDADHLVLKPWTELWEEYYSMPMAPVTAQEDTVWETRRGIDRTNGPVLFNAGFMIVRPDRSIFRSLLSVTDYYPGFQDQSIANKYFRPDGDHPWQEIPFRKYFWWSADESEMKLFTAIHTKFWADYQPKHVRREVARKVARMDGYWLAKNEEARREVETVRTA